jgi:hypothetical protein
MFHGNKRRGKREGGGKKSNERHTPEELPRKEEKRGNVEKRNDE